MKSSKARILNLILGTGIYLLDSLRDRIAEPADELRSKAQDTYRPAADHFSRADGEESHVLHTATAALLGLGIGVGIGLLLAPASGEETRTKLADKIRDLRDRVSSPERATATHAE